MPLPYSMESADKQMVVGDSEHQLLSRHLDSNGNGTGTKNMATTADDYWIEPPANQIYVIDQIRWMISDDALISAVLFGGIAALTTGCIVRTERQESTSPANTLLDLTDGEPVKTNADLGRHGSVEMISIATGSLVLAGWNLRELAAPIRLDGNKNERLLVKVQDDLSALAEMYVTVTGRKYQDLK